MRVGCLCVRLAFSLAWPPSGASSSVCVAMWPRCSSASVCVGKKKLSRKSVISLLLFFALLPFLSWIPNSIHLSRLHLSPSPDQSPALRASHCAPLPSSSSSFNPSLGNCLSSFFEREEGVGGLFFFSTAAPVSAAFLDTGRVKTNLSVRSKDKEERDEATHSSPPDALAPAEEETKMSEFPRPPPPPPPPFLSLSQRGRSVRLLSSARKASRDGRAGQKIHEKRERRAAIDFPSSQYTPHELELVEGMKSNIFYIMDHGSMPSGYPTYKEACLMLSQLLQTYDASLISRHRIGEGKKPRPPSFCLCPSPCLRQRVWALFFSTFLSILLSILCPLSNERRRPSSFILVSPQSYTPVSSSLLLLSCI